MSRTFKLSPADGLTHRILRATKAQPGGRLVRKYAHHQERRASARELLQQAAETLLAGMGGRARSPGGAIASGTATVQPEVQP